MGRRIPGIGAYDASVGSIGVGTRRQSTGIPPALPSHENGRERKKSMPGSGHSELMSALLDAYNQRDWEALESLVADDVDLFIPATGEQFRGREAVITFGQRWVSAYPDARSSDRAT